MTYFTCLELYFAVPFIINHIFLIFSKVCLPLRIKAYFLCGLRSAFGNLGEKSLSVSKPGYTLERRSGQRTTAAK